MLPANVVNSLQTLAKQVKPPIVADNSKANAEAGTQTETINKLEVGQQVQASIQEQVSPGLFKVQVAGQSMQMQLPGSPKVGNIITLKVESASPRLTYSFLASTTPIATAEQISSTSRLLANLAELPLGRAVIESAAGHPVWQTTDMPPDTKQLATGLKDALANSGLFYESHQAQWVSGERSTAQLLVEPQNQLDKQAVLNATTQQTATEAPIAKELVPLVQQQLHTLETHQIIWSGQVWPEQQMQWKIQGDSEHHAQQPEERLWSTEMELALPKLGDVHARLVLGMGGLKLTLRGADASSVELFNRQLPALAATLTDAGIQLTGAVVEKYD